MKLNPIKLFHILISVYIFLLGITALTGSESVKYVANGFAIFIFVTMSFNWFTSTSRNKIPKSLFISFFIFYTGLIGSMIFAPFGSNSIDILKIALAPLFLIFGYHNNYKNSTWDIKTTSAKYLFLFILSFPIAIYLISSFGTSDSINSAGIFTNRNNAGLYLMTLIAFYSILASKAIKSYLVYLGAGISFGTLGLLFATIISLSASTKNKKLSVIILGLIVSSSLFAFLFPHLFDETRIRPLIDSVTLLREGYIEIQSISYGELVRSLGTNDLSFLFRLKHWFNIIDIYFSGDLIQLIFGFGPGASADLSDMGLVPHNDFLRIIFEFGFISLIGFLLIIININYIIGFGWFLVPYLVVSIYFFSENLINNYLSMLILFFSAGVLISNKKLLADN